MTSQQPLERETTPAQEPPRPTGPRTPEGKARSRLNAFRHGITSQLCVITPEEQQAYEHHSAIILEALAPVGGFERDLAQSIADDRWRLKRARSIEAGMFAIGTPDHPVDNTGHSQVDDALAQARVWQQQAHNLYLLTIYEQRIQRAADKNMAQLEARQTRRQELAKDTMRQAKLLYQLAQAEGRPYQPEEFFVTAPEVRESVFSTSEVARELSREILLDAARTHWVYSPKPERKIAHSSTCAAPGAPKTADKHPHVPDKLSKNGQRTA